jgi:hypothetical protein
LPNSDSGFDVALGTLSVRAWTDDAAPWSHVREICAPVAARYGHVGALQFVFKRLNDCIGGCWLGSLDNCVSDLQETRVSSFTIQTLLDLDGAMLRLFEEHIQERPCLERLWNGVKRLRIPEPYLEAALHTTKQKAEARIPDLMNAIDEHRLKSRAVSAQRDTTRAELNDIESREVDYGPVYNPYDGRMEIPHSWGTEYADPLLASTLLRKIEELDTAVSTTEAKIKMMARHLDNIQRNVQNLSTVWEESIRSVYLE